MTKIKIRLALRAEGEFWNAYLALPDTMDNAKLIGSILIGTVKRSPAAKQMFMQLMQDILADAAEEIFGERPDKFDVGPAPESERSGHA